jgi:hypothetical protein
MSEYEDLARRVAALEAELAEAKRTLEASKPKEPFVPKPIPKPDWTEGMSMSGPAMKPIIDLINPQGLKYDPNAFARNRYCEPSGFGPPKGQWPKQPTKLREEEKLKIEKPPWSGWTK